MLVVDPRFRRRGMARMLINLAMDKMREQGTFEIDMTAYMAIEAQLLLL